MIVGRKTCVNPANLIPIRAWWRFRAGYALDHELIQHVVPDAHGRRRTGGSSRLKPVRDRLNDGEAVVLIGTNDVQAVCSTASHETPVVA